MELQSCSGMQVVSASCSNNERARLTCLSAPVTSGSLRTSPPTFLIITHHMVPASTSSRYPGNLWVTQASVAGSYRPFLSPLNPIPQSHPHVCSRPSAKAFPCWRADHVGLLRPFLPLIPLYQPPVTADISWEPTGLAC